MGKLCMYVCLVWSISSLLIHPYTHAGTCPCFEGITPVFWLRVHASCMVEL